MNRLKDEAATVAEIERRGGCVDCHNDPVGVCKAHRVAPAPQRQEERAAASDEYWCDACERPAQYECLTCYGQRCVECVKGHTCTEGRPWPTPAQRQEEAAERECEHCQACRRAGALCCWCYKVVPAQRQEEAQVDALARVLMEEFGGPTRSEGACEMAVRMLRELRAALSASEAATKDASLCVSCDKPPAVLCRFCAKEEFEDLRSQLFAAEAQATTLREALRLLRANLVGVLQEAEGVAHTNRTAAALAIEEADSALGLPEGASQDKERGDV